LCLIQGKGITSGDLNSRTGAMRHKKAININPAGSTHADTNWNFTGTINRCPDGSHG
jgi:hypothetical protein